MTENQSTATRRLSIADDTGVLSADVTDAYGLKPIVFHRNGQNVHLTWSEWAEVSDHVEYCRGIRPIIADEEEAYPLCGVGPGPVPYQALPCVLERGHGLGDGNPDQIGLTAHCDRLGRRW